MNAELDDSPDFRIRPATSLGRLISPWLASEKTDPSPQRNFYWSNRPGQHRGETFVIALMITLAVTGISAGLLIQNLVPSSIGGWLLVAFLVIPGYFAGLHLLIFSAAILEAFLNLVGIHPDIPPGHFCGRIFLLLLSASSVTFLLNPANHLLLRISAGFWTGIAIANLAAWFLLRLRDLRNSLSSLESS